MSMMSGGQLKTWGPGPGSGLGGDQGRYWGKPCSPRAGVSRKRQGGSRKAGRELDRRRAGGLRAWGGSGPASSAGGWGWGDGGAVGRQGRRPQMRGSLSEPGRGAWHGEGCRGCEAEAAHSGCSCSSGAQAGPRGELPREEATSRSSSRADVTLPHFTGRPWALSLLPPTSSSADLNSSVSPVRDLSRPSWATIL